MNILAVLLALVLFAVVAILLFGIIAMARGGEFNRKYGNKMMRWRVAIQALAVVLVLLFVFVASVGGK
ncbi:MAG: twin transmembrane helix small protein [Alphaproteobacteria bacterium]|nr:twin transmembrane helix small protein [Alphaproteobacteria bacterium]